MTREACGGCGRDPAEGFAMIATKDGESRYCHEGPSPTCYENAQLELAGGEGVLKRLLALLPD